MLSSRTYPALHDVIQVDVATDGRSFSELAILCDDSAERIQPYAEQQGGFRHLLSIGCT